MTLHLPAVNAQISGALFFANKKDLEAAREAIHEDRDIEVILSTGWNDPLCKLEVATTRLLGPSNSNYPHDRPSWMTTLSKVASYAARGHLLFDFGLDAGKTYTKYDLVRSWRAIAGGYMAPLVRSETPRTSVRVEELSPFAHWFCLQNVIQDRAGEWLFIAGGANLTNKKQREILAGVAMLDARTLSEPVRFVGFNSEVKSVDLSPDEETVYAVDMAGNMRSFDRSTGETKAAKRFTRLKQIDNPTIKVCDDGTVLTLAETTLSRWSPKLKPISELSLSQGSHLSFSISAFSKSGAWVAISGGGVSIWKTENPAQRIALLPPRWVTSLAFSPGEDLLLIIDARPADSVQMENAGKWTGSDISRQLILIDLATMNELWSVKAPGNISSAVFSEDGTRIYGAGWERKTWVLRVLSLFEGHENLWDTAPRSH